MSSLSVQAGPASGAATHAPLPASGDAGRSTSALVVELSQLRYAVRAHVAGGAWGSAGVVDSEVRSLLRRRDAVLAELRGRGLDFAVEHVDPPRPHGPATASVEPAPDRTPSTAVDLIAKVEQLERGLSSRTVIGQAQGILIERHQVTADGAFRMLVQASSTSNRKLRDIAADLVLTGELAGCR